MSIPFNVLKYNCKVQKLQGTIIPINLYESPYEATLEIDGLSYHIIFGHQINGWFLCIPNWKIGVEMAHPSDTFWNRESLCTFHQQHQGWLAGR